MLATFDSRPPGLSDDEPIAAKFCPRAACWEDYSSVLEIAAGRMVISNDGSTRTQSLADATNSFLTLPRVGSVRTEGASHGGRSPPASAMIGSPTPRRTRRGPRVRRSRRLG